jgi:hypothetical protein
MKAISQYLEGIEDGEVIPSISGEIISVKVDEETGKQTITIATGTESIKITIKDKAAWVVDPVKGHILSMNSSHKGGASKGLTYKINKTSKIPYIIASAGVTSQVTSPVSVTEEEQEPMTAADTAIDNLVLDRLYIYGRVKRMVREINSQSIGIDFPEEKIPELTTSIHLDLKHMQITPRPTDKQLERKQVHKAVAEKKREAATPKESSKSDEPPKRTKTASDGWKDFKHPMSGERLGDVSLEKMEAHFFPWMFRTDPSTLKPATAELHRVLGEAMVGLKLTPQMLLEKYITHYAGEYSPTSTKRRDKAIAKFCDGLVEKGETKNNIMEGSVTENEATAVLRNFGSLWKEIVESE